MEAAKMKELEQQFSQPTRQSGVAIIFLLLNFVRELISRFWPLLIAFFIGGNRSESRMDTWLAKVGLVISAFSVIVSIISYFRLFFYIEGKDLVLEKGWLRRLKLSIPIDRIQSINFEQNILHRIFNVVKVDIETAGSKGNELSLIALKRENAEELRAFLLAEREKMGGLEVVEDEGIGATGEKQPELKKELLFLSIKDLLRAGLSENPFRGFVIIIAVASVMFGEISSLLGDEWIESTISSSGIDMDIDVEQSALNLLFIIGAIIFPLMMLASWLLTFGLTVSSYYQLRFWETAKGYRLVHGIFQRKERSAQRSKIQFMVWSTQPLQQIFGMYRSYLYLAGDESSRRSVLRLVGAYGHHIEALRESLFPGHDPASLALQGIDPKAAYRRFLFRGIIPGALLALALWGWLSLLSLIWIGIQLPLAIRYQRKWRWGLDNEIIYTKSQVIGQRHRLLSLYKVQAVAVMQNWYQQRHGLATLILYTASGRTFNVPYISLEKAFELRDYVNYRIESDERAWM